MNSSRLTTQLEPLAPLLVTMGDAAGIGPEIIAKAFLQGHLNGAAVVGDAAVMRRALALASKLSPAHRIGGASPGSALGAMTALIEHPALLAQVPPHCLPVIEPANMPGALAELALGQVHAPCGAAAALCIEQAAQWALAGQARAVVTAPLHKEALSAAGLHYPGHTEMLQALAGGPPVRMMLANEELRVVLVTIHLSLRKAIEALNQELVLQTLRIANQAGQQMGWPNPRIAVAGLNPHAGEGGLFGDEEIHIIAPAVRAAQAQGVAASGPYAPDTVFMRARQGQFDFVVAMTHDHGLIPVKYLGVEQGVNVTLGLPFVRTSPDHGTAFDIAGQGRADPSSLVAAVAWARRATRALGSPTPSAA